MEVEYTEDFERWWHLLDLEERELVDVAARILARRAGALGAEAPPEGAEGPAEHVLHVEQAGRAVEVAYRFDAECGAVVLVGGRRSG